MTMMIAYGRVPTISNYDALTEYNSITLKPGSKGYNKQGTYYVKVLPKWNLFSGLTNA